MIGVLAVLAGLATTAQAQLAVQQPTEKVALLPLSVMTTQDSATSVRTMDAARTRLEALAKYKALIIPKKSLCEVLTKSGYQCDELLDAEESRQLAQAMGLDAYTLGRLERRSGHLA